MLFNCLFYTFQCLLCNNKITQQETLTFLPIMLKWAYLTKPMEKRAFSLWGLFESKSLSTAQSPNAHRTRRVNDLISILHNQRICFYFKDDKKRAYVLYKWHCPPTFSHYLLILYKMDKNYYKNVYHRIPISVALVFCIS